jgi:hypothetical protein
MMSLDKYKNIFKQFIMNNILYIQGKLVAQIWKVCLKYLNTNCKGNAELLSE